MEKAKLKMIPVSVETHKLLQLYKSATGTRTLEEVILKALSLDENYESYIKLIRK